MYDGGYLVSSTRDLRGIKQHRASVGFQARAAFNPLEKAVRHGRLQPFTPLLRIGFGAVSGAWKAIKGLRSHDPANEAPDAVNGGYGFDPRWVNVNMSWPSRILMKRISTERIIEQRRKNFARMAESFIDVPGCKILFQVLDQSVVPYVFPLVIEDYQRVFHELKMQRVPIYRWENLRGGGCEVSRRYSQQLLQFPCHQELTEREVDWMIQKIVFALRKTKGSES